MSDKTGIQWTEATWNPLRGCRKISPGCTHCYAANMAARFSGPGQPYEDLAYFDARKRGQWTGKIRFIEEHVGDPVRWRKPRRVFVNSMSDLFHEAVPNEFIALVFAVMAAAPRHTFQVLTKRPERMRAWFDWAAEHPFRDGAPGGGPQAAMGEALCNFPGRLTPTLDSEGDEGTAIHEALDVAWPLPNVWLGVSVEDQYRAHERIPALLQTPAAVRFLSCEPLLGPLNLTDITREGLGRDALRVNEPDDLFGPAERHIDWVIVGGESQDGAREMDSTWPRQIRDQCREAGVAFFMKQMGGAHNKRGRLEDLPEDLRIREFPEVPA